LELQFLHSLFWGIASDNSDKGVENWFESAALDNPQTLANLPKKTNSYHPNIMKQYVIFAIQSLEMIAQMMFPRQGGETSF
jgi:hypothetical protein